MELLGAEAAGRPAFGRVATGGRTVTRVFACGVEGAGRDAAEIKSTVLAFIPIMLSDISKLVELITVV